MSGQRTGRSPADRRVVDTNDSVWWGPPNTRLSHDGFVHLREHAIDCLNTCHLPGVFVVDCYANYWDAANRFKVLMPVVSISRLLVLLLVRLSVYR
jgi:ATP-dependent phosphoenolpyruvate carboxykinase